jgi:gas vesicle protein
MVMKKVGGIAMRYEWQSLRIGTTALLTGFCFGLGTGILLAPHSGARTRRRLKNFTEDMIEDTKEVIDEATYTGKHLKGLMAVR